MRLLKTRIVKKVSRWKKKVLQKGGFNRTVEDIRLTQVGSNGERRSKGQRCLPAPLEWIPQHAGSDSEVQTLGAFVSTVYTGRHS